MQDGHLAGYLCLAKERQLPMKRVRRASQSPLRHQCTEARAPRTARRCTRPAASRRRPRTRSTRGTGSVAGRSSPPRARTRARQRCRPRVPPPRGVRRSCSARGRARTRSWRREGGSTRAARVHTPLASATRARPPGLGVPRP
eukprot:3449873-Pleurochrysis_carterae.AAC.1